MDYLPFENFEIHTTLTSDEVFYRLRAAVETKKPWWQPLFAVRKSYYGEVNRNSFRLVRVTSWNRNFTPQVLGTIQWDNLGSSIQITMRLNSGSLLFWAFWLGCVGCMFFGGLANQILEMIQTGIWKIESLGGILPLILMFAFGYLLVMVSFKIETSRVKEFLVKLTEAKVESIHYKDRIFGLSEFQIIKWILLVVMIVSLGWVLYLR